MYDIGLEVREEVSVGGGTWSETLPAVDCGEGDGLDYGCED